MITHGEDVEIHALRKQGWSISAIARHMGLDRKTVRAYLCGDREVGVGCCRTPAGCAARLDPRTLHSHDIARIVEEPPPSDAAAARLAILDGPVGSFGRVSVWRSLEDYLPDVDEPQPEELATPSFTLALALGTQRPPPSRSTPPTRSPACTGAEPSPTPHRPQAGPDWQLMPHRLKGLRRQTAPRTLCGPERRRPQRGEVPPPPERWATPSSLSRRAVGEFSHGWPKRTYRIVCSDCTTPR